MTMTMLDLFFPRDVTPPFLVLFFFSSFCALALLALFVSFVMSSFYNVAMVSSWVLLVFGMRRDGELFQSAAGVIGSLEMRSFPVGL